MPSRASHRKAVASFEFWRFKHHANEEPSRSATRNGRLGLRRAHHEEPAAIPRARVHRLPTNTSPLPVTAMHSRTDGQDSELIESPGAMLADCQCVAPPVGSAEVSTAPELSPVMQSDADGHVTALRDTFDLSSVACHADE